MSWVVSRFRTGDLVEVRSKEEILASLDDRGRLDGMPFMPEMLEFCGKQMRIGAVAHKTCDTISGESHGRKLRTAVHLEGVRCVGTAHGGCEADCYLFWKDEWLRPVGAAAEPQPATWGGGCTDQALRAATRQETAGGDDVRYFCQATELLAATEPLPWWNITQYLLDVRTGNRSARRASRVLFLAQLRRLRAHMPVAGRVVGGLHRALHRVLTGRSYPSLFGTVPEGERAPSERLDLQPGELVRIKPLGRIGQTIGANWRNRGLWFDAGEMGLYCGQVARVRRPVKKIIDEATGTMLEMKESCIMLEGVVCRAEYSSCRLNCPRAIPSFWREIWLERIDGQAGAGAPAAASHEPGAAGPAGGS